MELSENYSCVDCIWHDQCESDMYVVLYDDENKEEKTE